MHSGVCVGGAKVQAPPTQKVPVDGGTFDFMSVAMATISELKSGKPSQSFVVLVINV